MTDVHVQTRLDLERLHPASFGWALVCCGHDREEAEEVLQEVYLSVLESRARFDGRSTARTWLFAVIRRTAAARRRRGWRRRLALARWFERQPAPPPTRSPESALEAAETTSALREALARLPERQRQVLHLAFYQDLTVEEAARVMGVSLGSARTHYHRGKEAVRLLLSEEAP
jgi:RNA polymerase sigma-70 factor (ECF subfamily)